MSIKVNDEVRIKTEVGSADPDKIGKVINIYKLSGGDIAIVDFHKDNKNGEIEKVPVSDLVKVTSRETSETDELPEGAKRISRKEMDDALLTVTSPEGVLAILSKDDPTICMLGALAVGVVGCSIIKELYGDKDEIVITKDQFSDALFNGVKLDKLRESVNGEMNTTQLLPIGLMSAIVLKGMIPILFGDESENA